VVSVSANKTNDFEKFIGKRSFEKLGQVTKSNVEIDGESWNNIDYWKEKYDTAIEKYFKNYLPE
jgi:hypothetical protein